MAELKRAMHGAAAYREYMGKGGLPPLFPRIIGPNAIKYLAEVVDSGLTVDMVGRFEKRFAEEMEVKHCIAATGCSMALLMLAEALNFEPGSEVIFSPVTDYGTIMGFYKNGCVPVFADTAPESINVSAETIAPCISEKTKAIVVVHKTGLMCDMEPIVELAKKNNLFLVEDVCQAVFSKYNGRYAGTFGDAAAFSFDSEKTMGSDVGGCIITNNDALAEYARFRCQSRGAVIKPGFGRTHIVPGNALRMPNCTAAMCLAQLEIIKENVAGLDRMARNITTKFKSIPGIKPMEIPDYQDVYSAWIMSFSIETDEFTCTPQEFAEDCAKLGIADIGMAYYYLLPEACIFLKDVIGDKQFPNAKKFINSWIRWVSFSEKYSDEDCETIIEIVRKVAKKYHE